MKRNLYLILPLLISCLPGAFAQKLSFQYDAAGNQVSREWVCVNCTTAEELKEAAVKAEENTELFSETFPEEEEPEAPAGPVRSLSVYPNPTSSTLEVKWESDDGTQVKTIYVYSMHSRLVYQGSIAAGQRQTELNFSSLPEGVYVVWGLYTDGTKASVKVIKQ